MIWLPQIGVEIRTSPKVLSSSLKSMAYRLETGRDFEPYTRAGRTIYKHVHELYPTKPMGVQAVPPARYRVAFVRDPVERFVSFYRNRILARDLRGHPTWDRVRQTSLPLEPSPAQLLIHFDEYRRLVASVRHHTEEQVTFLGPEARYYDFIFNSQQVGRFEELMSQWSGTEVRMPHQQRSGNKFVDLTDDDISRLKERYSVDYTTFGVWF